jgi:type VI secretion system protein ImpK
MTDAFAELVMPIFRKGIDLQERLSGGDDPTLEEVKDLATGWIEEARQRAAGNAALKRSLGLALFGLVAWIDEFLFNSDWAARTGLYPQDEILEWVYFGTRLRAVRFYSEAYNAESAPDMDALEVYLLALTLGFRGRPAAEFEDRSLLRDGAGYRGSRGGGDEAVPGWVAGLYQVVSGAGGVADRPFPEDPANLNRFGPLRGPSLLLRVSVLVSITALVTLAAYLLAVHIYWNARHPGSTAAAGRAPDRAGIVVGQGLRLDDAITSGGNA